MEFVIIGAILTFGIAWLAVVLVLGFNAFAAINNALADQREADQRKEQFAQCVAAGVQPGTAQFTACIEQAGGNVRPDFQGYLDKFGGAIQANIGPDGINVGATGAAGDPSFLLPLPPPSKSALENIFPPPSDQTQSTDQATTAQQQTSIAATPKKNGDDMMIFLLIAAAIAVGYFFFSSKKGAKK